MWMMSSMTKRKQQVLHKQYLEDLFVKSGNDVELFFYVVVLVVYGLAGSFPGHRGKTRASNGAPPSLAGRYLHRYNHFDFLKYFRNVRLSPNVCFHTGTSPPRSLAKISISSQPCGARGDYDPRHGSEPSGETGGDQGNKPVPWGQGLPGATQVSKENGVD